MLLALAALTAALAAQDTTGSLRGVVFDSLAGAPLGGAIVQIAPAEDALRARTARADSLGRFRFDALAPGTWIATFAHPSVDVLDVELPLRGAEVAAGDAASLTLGLPNGVELRRAVCPANERDSTAAVFGVVRHAETGAPLSPATVTLAWTEIALSRTGAHPAARREQVTTRANGLFLLCGVPSDADLTLRAESAGFVGGALDVPVVAGAIVRRDVALGPALVAHPDTTPVPNGARLRGVVADEAGRGVPFARVLVLGTAGRATADSAGRFAIEALPPGGWTVEARAIGYEPARLSSVLSREAPATETVRMRRVVPTLDRVVVRGRPQTRTSRLAGFVERQRRGNGTFLGPEAVERRAILTPTDALRSVPGLVMLPRRLGRGAVVRGPGGCVPTVWIDDVPIVDGANDLDDLLASRDVLTIEVYRDQFAPAQFVGGQLGRCGVIVIQTRRGR